MGRDGFSSFSLIAGNWGPASVGQAWALEIKQLFILFSCIFKANFSDMASFTVRMNASHLEAWDGEGGREGDARGKRYGNILYVYN